MGSLEGGGWGLISGECLRHGPITGVALAKRGWEALKWHEKKTNKMGFILNFSD